jgi:hypothetical protein
VNEENMRKAFSVNVHINKVCVNQKDYTAVLALSVAG